MGSLRLPKVFFTSKQQSDVLLASWVTSQSLFPIVYSYSCHWEGSWICSNGKIYLCVFWSLCLNKQTVNTIRCLDSFQFRACSFNSCSERAWLCQLICTKSIPFLNYLKLLLHGILTFVLIAGCNFKCISSKNIPKPTLAAIKPTSLCIFLQLLTKSGFGCKFGERFQKTFETFKSCHPLPTCNFGTFWFWSIIMDVWR